MILLIKIRSICTDLGSGAGLPGIVLAIIMKHKNSDMQFNLYEKSYHKSKFLEEVSRKLNLNTKVFNQNIFEQENLYSEIIVARAFKPMIVILDLVNKSFKKFNNIILLLGKNGKSSIKECQKKWKFDYVEKNSLTNEESLMIKISNLKKMKNKIISVINQKGGVGKTTTVINLAAGLSLLDKKILVIDLDPQGNATTGLGLSNIISSDQTIYGVLNGTCNISSVIKKTNYKI